MRSPFTHRTTEERRALILEGSVPRTLIQLSVPTLMLGLVQALMPFTDGLFVNNAAGTLVAGAVLFSEPIVNMAQSLAQGLSVAAMAIVGQLNGKGDFAKAKKTSTQIVVAGSAFGLACAPFLLVAGFLVSRSVHPEISRNVFLYLSLYAFVLPFSFMESIYNGIKNANGQPEATFVRMVLMLILKVAFNALFVLALRLGIVGCVLASLLSNVIISVWMFHELFVRESPDRLELTGFSFDFRILRGIVATGAPAMLMSLLLNLGFFLINSETESYGPIVLNGQGIAGNITSVCFILPGSFSAAVTTMVSMYVGAGRPGRARRATIVGCAISALTAAAVIAVIVPLSPYLTVLFTRDEGVLGVANRALHIYTYSVIGFGICMTIQGAFVGLGRTKVPLVLSVLRIWFLRYVFILATERYLEYYAVFWGNLFSNYLAALISIVLIVKTDWSSGIRVREADESPRA